MTNDINFKDGRHQLHCALKGVLPLNGMKINKYWQLKDMQEKESYHECLEHLENSVHQDQQNLMMPDGGFFFYMHQTPTEDSYMNPQH